MASRLARAGCSHAITHSEHRNDIEKVTEDRLSWRAAFASPFPYVCFGSGVSMSFLDDCYAKLLCKQSGEYAKTQVVVSNQTTYYPRRTVVYQYGRVAGVWLNLNSMLERRHHTEDWHAYTATVYTTKFVSHNWRMIGKIRSR